MNKYWVWFSRLCKIDVKTKNKLLEKYKMELTERYIEAGSKSRENRIYIKSRLQNEFKKIYRIYGRKSNTFNNN